MNLNYLISIVWFVLWLAALVDCLQSNNPNKVVWAIVIILVPILGSILYFLLGRSVRA
ncbi:MAG TPA: PLDc N-terminal domain-containing protein [Lacunisphaera sp.]|nr:PLDc N-terminal domain-containing protein [Lacunisphaera sp.]